MLHLVVSALFLMQSPNFTLAAVNNPSAVTFTPSIDPVDSYQLEIMRPDNTILQTLSLGKPATVTTFDAGGNPILTCTAALNVQPVSFGSGYYVRVEAIAGGVASDPAISLNSFNRVAGGPTKVVIK